MDGEGSRLTTFVAPRPNRLLIALMGPVNRLFMLRGLPILRDIPPLNRVPGLRGVANVRDIDFPVADQARLAGVSGKGHATFYTPNHPEFFTDWMIDKEVQSMVAPLCASWATNGIVNGLGALAQRFWLANNLIAQIPGNSAPARAHSVQWALQGNGVLLHPEGAVGWHGDWIAPLMDGAVEMAMEACRLIHGTGGGTTVWIAPIAWKLAFMRDVEPELLRECGYVERRLRLGQGAQGMNPADRVFRIYEALLSRDEEKAGIVPRHGADFADRLDAVVSSALAALASKLPASSDRDADPVRHARRWMREAGKSADAIRLKSVSAAVDTIQRLRRLGPFAWASQTMTQEQAAEHIKRVRNDYCKGTMRDTLNALVPQPAGPRRAHIRVAEPLAISDPSVSVDDLTEELRRRMQAALDGINATLWNEDRFKSYPNPFYRQSA